MIIVTIAIDRELERRVEYTATEFLADDDGIEENYLAVIASLMADGAEAGLSAVRAANAGLLRHPGGGDDGAGAYQDRLDHARSAFSKMRAVSELEIEEVENERRG